MATHEYAFDVKLFAAVRVKASTVKEARAKLRDILDGHDFQLGLADLRIGVVSLDDDGADLYERDGEDVSGLWPEDKQAL